MALFCLLLLVLLTIGRSSTDDALKPPPQNGMLLRGASRDELSSSSSEQISTSSITQRSARPGNPKLVPYNANHPFFDQLPNNNDRHLQFRPKQKQQYQPIRFHVDTRWLTSTPPATTDDETVQFLLRTVIPEANRFWSEALRVYPVSEPIRIDDNFCRHANTSQIQVGVDDADVVIYAIRKPDCGANDNIVTSEYCQFDEFGRPVVGSLEFCVDSIDPTDESNRQSTLRSVLHQYGRLLGARSDSLVYFLDPHTGRYLTPPSSNTTQVTCIDGSIRMVKLPSPNTLREGNTRNGARYFEVVTPTVATVVRNHFGCEEMDGARLENRVEVGEESCFGEPWDARLFSDFMTSTDESPRPLSPLTLALFEDSGWYLGNYSITQTSSFGRGAGCDFVFGECITNSNVPDYSQNVFCNVSDQNALQCSYDYESIAACDLMEYGFDANNGPVVPPEYQYFTNPRLGGANPAADFCPTYSADLWDCTSSQTPSFGFHDVEFFGTSSKCWNTDWKRPLCLETHCNPEQQVVEVMVNGTMMTCELEGQMIAFADGYAFECPPLATICPDLICPADCSGRGMCNHTLKPPQCTCFNETDRSTICENSSPPRIEFLQPTNTTPENNTLSTPNDAQSPFIVMAVVLSTASLLLCCLLVECEELWKKRRRRR